MRSALRRAALIAMSAGAVGCATRPAAPPAPSLLPAGWQRGITFTSFQPRSYESPVADRALDALRGTGATHVVLTPTLYMGDERADRVAPLAAKTPTDASVIHAMGDIRARGMKVVLKPHVDVVGGAFRGDIAPRDPAAWFASYARVVDRYARLARRGGAALFVIGTELTSMSRYTARWRALIAGARGRFAGPITFAANWTAGARRIAFWDDLDLIGIDAYMPLGVHGEDPPVAAIRAAWEPEVARIAALQRRWRKPVIFTELGYPSRLGAAADPLRRSGRVSAVAQARAYQAALEVWSRPSWFRGIYWWEWSAEGLNQRTGDGSFRPAGKEAERVLRRWY